MPCVFGRKPGSQILTLRFSTRHPEIQCEEACSGSSVILVRHSIAKSAPELLPRFLYKFLTPRLVQFKLGTTFFPVKQPVPTLKSEKRKLAKGKYKGHLFLVVVSMLLCLEYRYLEQRKDNHKNSFSLQI